MHTVSSLLPPELQFLSKRLVTIQSDSIWREFPEACWNASGGDPALGSIATLAFLAGTLAVKVLDDVQDQHIHPQQSNDGMALAFHALQLLELFPSSDPSAIARLQRSYTHTILAMCAGQHLDLMGTEAIPVENLLEHGWKIAREKTGYWFAWGASLCSRLCGDTQATEVLERFGTCIGLMHQIANDVSGFFDTTEKGDLKAKKASIPIAYLRTVLANTPQQEEFISLWEQAENSDSVRQRIVEIARASGVETYLKVVTNQQAFQARTAIEVQFPRLVSLISHRNLRIPGLRV